MALEVENMFNKKSHPKHHVIVRELLRGKKVSAETLAEKLGAPLSNRMMGLVIEQLTPLGVTVERTRDQANGTEYRASLGTVPKKAVKKAAQKPVSAPVAAAKVKKLSTVHEAAEETTEATAPKPVKKGNGKKVATKKGGLKRG